MKKTRIKWVLIISIVMIVLLAAGLLIYKFLAPSSEQKDLNSIFQLKQDEVALVVDGELLEERGKKAGGEIYIPAQIVSSYMDQRVYVDAVENCLSYATAEGVIVAREGTVEYRIGKQTKEEKQPLLKKIHGTLYVALSFVAQHTSCSFKKYDKPSRLVIMSQRDKTYTFANVTEDSRVRTGPGKKYPYLVEVAEGGRIIVDNAVKQENNYRAIMTEDGVKGYIPEERLGKKKEETWKFDKEPESFPQLSMGKKVCLGWHQISNVNASGILPSSVAQATAMNVICPTWYALKGNERDFTSLADSAYVSQAHDKGLKVWGLINDFDKNIKLTQILGKTSTRTKLVNNLVATAIQHDLDGINIDFEKVTKDSASAYLEFLRELTLKCHVNDLVVSVDNYTPAGYNSYYDLEEQGKIVDYVILMAYDEHYAGSEESGSVSSLPFVKQGVENVLAKVPKERMITALPFYTRLWKEVKGRKPSSEAYGMSGAESIVRANEGAPKWDEASGQYYAQFKSGSAVYKIWLEEETSLKKKLEIVKENKCAGVAFWKLGFERAVTWTMISEQLKG